MWFEPKGTLLLPYLGVLALIEYLINIPMFNEAIPYPY